MVNELLISLRNIFQKSLVIDEENTKQGPVHTETISLRFCIFNCSEGNREQATHYLKQFKNAGKRFRVYEAQITTVTSD